MYNDLGFTVGKESPKLMILLEAQSTWTINVLVRIMLYLAESLQEYIVKHNLNVFILHAENIYSNSNYSFSAIPEMEKEISPIGVRLKNSWTPLPMSLSILGLFFPSVLLMIESISCLKALKSV